MSDVDFFKMSGSGNDFIVVDNRAAILDTDNLGAFVKKICRRRLSVGADGFIALEESNG